MLNFYIDKVVWKFDFELFNEVSGDVVDIIFKIIGYLDVNQYDVFIKQLFCIDKLFGLFIWYIGDLFKQLVDEGFVVEIIDIWSKVVDEGWVSEDLCDSYMFDGKQYCVLMNIVYWIMFYNKVVFVDNGIEVLMMWDELNMVVEMFKDVGVILYYQISVLFIFQWFQYLVVLIDFDLYEGFIMGEVKYIDFEIVDIMNVWFEEQQNGWFSDVGSMIDFVVGLKQGDYVMINFGMFFVGNFEGVGMIFDDYGMFVIFVVSDDFDVILVVVELGFICMVENLKQCDFGFVYVEWWMLFDVQIVWNDVYGDVVFNLKVKVFDFVLVEIGEQIVGDDYMFYDWFFEVMFIEIVIIVIEQFGVFNVNLGDLMLFLEKIQVIVDKYWVEQE